MAIIRQQLVHAVCDTCGDVLRTFVDTTLTDEEIRAVTERNGGRSAAGRDACPKKACIAAITPGTHAAPPP